MNNKKINAELQVIEECIEQDIHAFNIHDSQAEVDFHAGKRGLFWKRELEIVYDFHGFINYYIDGRYYPAAENQMLLINPYSIERTVIESSRIHDTNRVEVTVIHISQKLLKSLFPDIENLCFINEKSLEGIVPFQIFRQISDYIELQKEDKRFFLITGLIYQMLYYIDASAVVKKDRILNEKNISDAWYSKRENDD